LSDQCRIILLCAEGLQSNDVAERLGVRTLGKWWRFVHNGIEGLIDEILASVKRFCQKTISRTSASRGSSDAVPLRVHGPG
jgi:putative transposase